MSLTLPDLTINFQDLDLEDIFSSWQWLLAGQKSLAILSKMGDMFLIGEDNRVNWLQTGVGTIDKVADSLEDFVQMLADEANVDNWFLPSLVEELIRVGKLLKNHEVYSFINPPILGGDYSVDNFMPVDISVHFAFAGQICEQVRNLPDGTKVNIKYKPADK
jgi:hypothetical protein